MALQQILVSLSNSDALADEAQRLARQKFLEWLVSLPQSADVRQSAAVADDRARKAVNDTDSPAAILAFCELLRQVEQTPVCSVEQGRRRRRPEERVLN
ncbi:MAG: hypothetical protein CSB44_04545 [Gammaproteobacteria bacterium]|nr:MAG: hypothetical protein CSB44_04545 [Gammaproteobacteria bacterium]